MTAILPLIVDHIVMMREHEKRNILIHCHAGMQRSAISVAGYLVYRYGMTPMQAIKYIIAKRPIAFFGGDSINFDDSLKTYHKNLKICKRISGYKQPK
jgi:protein-tyrosine phosphatase